MPVNWVYARVCAQHLNRRRRQLKFCGICCLPAQDQRRDLSTTKLYLYHLVLKSQDHGSQMNAAPLRCRIRELTGYRDSGTAVPFTYVDYGVNRHVYSIGSAVAEASGLPRWRNRLDQAVVRLYS